MKKETLEINIHPDLDQIYPDAASDIIIILVSKGIIFSEIINWNIKMNKFIYFIIIKMICSSFKIIQNQVGFAKKYSVL
jgi:hypothetical protein